MTEPRIIRQRAPDVDAMAAAMVEFLTAAGFESRDEEHLERTGSRVADAWVKDLLEGYEISPAEALGEPFGEEARDMVLIKDIEFFSSCPHHLMPYQGRAHIAYIPDGKVVGFSGVVRLLDCLAHRFTLQEWLCRDLTATLGEVLKPAGAGCIIEATPMCVFAHGVRRPCRITTTSFTGLFADDPSLRRDLLLASGACE